MKITFSKYINILPCSFLYQAYFSLLIPEFAGTPFSLYPYKKTCNVKGKYLSVYELPNILSIIGLCSIFGHHRLRYRTAKKMLLHAKCCLDRQLTRFETQPTDPCSLWTNLKWLNLRYPNCRQSKHAKRVYS